MSGISSTGLAYIDGGAGNDWFIGSSGYDTFRGGTGNDILEGANGNDTLKGDAGDDRIEGGNGADVIDGGAGNDTIRIGGAEALSDTISGGAGTDTLVLTSTVTLKNISPVTERLDGQGYGIQGTDGNENFNLAAFTSVANVAFVNGGAGDDVIDGGALSNDVLIGGAGDDWLIGREGADTLTGGAGADQISGGVGNDLIRIGGTEGIGDQINGNAGTDTLEFTSNVTLSNFFRANCNEVEILNAKGFGIQGTSGNDTIELFGFSKVIGLASINGGAGNDMIIGTKANDVVMGGAGNDTLNGAYGSDTLTGGAGNDTFLFDADPTGAITDYIKDFGDVAGNQDVIDLSYVVSLGGSSRVYFPEWKAANVKQSGANVDIRFGDDHLIITNVKVAALDEADFFFSTAG
ncbi:MAG: hypothetical protein LBE78_11520 [Burkholderiaceae bacterium]|nr:hypothetical protein [Burkholderiaceae bacterium]